MTARTVTRRHFLKTAAATGAACAVPLVFPDPRWGWRQGRAPSNRITMGFIGTGRQARGPISRSSWRSATCRWWPSATWIPGASARPRRRSRTTMPNAVPAETMPAAPPSRTSAN